VLEEIGYHLLVGKKRCKWILNDILWRLCADFVAETRRSDSQQASISMK
jgi:hypothetical protein